MTYTMEKQHSHSDALPAPVSTPKRPTNRKVIIGLFAALLLLAHFGPLRGACSRAWSPDSPASPFQAKTGGCEQVPPLLPPKDVHNISTVWSAKDRIISWHQESVRIPTEVWDEMGAPGEDSRWKIFERLHELYEKSYPLVHKHLRRTKVDTWGLIFEWEGSDNSLKPLFITGHQDVVPVLQETVYQWIQPPFSGEYDGEWIWGRGSSDDKSTVTAVLAAIELLLESGDFTPTRTVVLGFGHDEERGGMRGAPAIRDWLLNKYGKGSMAMLIDEGSGIQNSWGRTFGLPAVAEKGKYDLNITVSTLGGHSSVPPPHTGIGLASLLVAELERNPHQPRLEPTSPIWGFLQCAAAHAPDMPKDVRKALHKAGDGTSRKRQDALIDVLLTSGVGSGEVGPGQGNMVRALLSTTQAADMIRGGVKVNALPEVVEVIVNHRLDVASSIKELKARVFEVLAPVAHELGLTITGFGQTKPPKGESKGTVYLGDCGFSEDLEPAPISPFTTDSPAWRMLAGTSRGVWASRPGVGDGEVAELSEEDQLVMSPFHMSGNTDTRRYWDLTDNIYRWRYFSDSQGEGIHTINERVSADAMVEFVRFFQALILNVDASREL